MHRSVGAFFHDLAHSVLHFEGKIWRTLPLLAWHPGQLTRRYIAGERARFVSPLALFLFSVFLMFATLNMVGSPMDFAGDGRSAGLEDAGREVAAERVEAERKLDRLTGELAAARESGAPTAALERRLTAERTENALRERAAAAALRGASGEEAEEDGGNQGFNVLSETGWKALDDAVDKAERNPSLLLYKLQANAYKFSWALVPISLPFLWILFLHRRRYRRDFDAYDHLVFITYSIAFMSLFAIALSLLRSVGLSDGIIGTAFMLVPPVHIYRQLRGAYSLSRTSALWRTLVLLVFTAFTTSLFLVLLTVLGVFG